MQSINLCYKSGKTAKAKLKLELLDKTKLEVIAYNEIADYAFRNLKINDIIYINGKILGNEVEILEIAVI